MSVRSTAKVLRAPGRLSIQPSDADLLGAFPYGGTAMGYSLEVTMRRVTDNFTVLAEEWGGVPVEVIEAGEWWLVGGFFAAWDPDVVATLFPNTRTGALQNSPVVRLQHNGTRRAGHRLSDRAKKLVFTPDDPGRNPAWVIYRGLPLIDASRRLNFERTDELGLGFVFVGIPAATSAQDVGEIGPLYDLTVSP